MKQNFDIPVVRTVHQHLTISVEAENYEKACELALDQAGDYEFPGEKSADYSIEGDYRQRCLEAAASAFCSGDEPLVEYEKLLQASEDGQGDEDAASIALIWQPIMDFHVDTVIGLIENHADAIMAITSD